MATSASYNFNLNRDQALLVAFQMINVMGGYDTTTTLAASQEYQIGHQVFNGMLKMWSADGIKIPKRKQAYLFPIYQTAQHSLGSVSGASHATNSYVSTTISSAEAAGQTVLSLTSTTGMTAADFIGIELDSGTRQWTTIVSVDSSTQVTITAALTGAAASGNTVVTYTTKINKPLEVLYGTMIDLKSSNLSEVPLSAMSHDEYLQLPVKSTVGRPNQFYFDGVISGSSPYISSFYLYPSPQNVHEIARLVYVDGIQDLDSATDDIDLPQEWTYPVIVNLAAELALFYGKFTELATIQPKADKLYDLLKDQTSDGTPLNFSIDGRR